MDNLEKRVQAQSNNDGIQFARDLLTITEDCNANMQEPLNGGVTAWMTGVSFLGIARETARDMTLVLHKNRPGLDTDALTMRGFNMATLVAFARIGAEVVLENLEEDDATAHVGKYQD